MKNIDHFVLSAICCSTSYILIFSGETANKNKTWQECLLDDPLQKFCYFIRQKINTAAIRR